MTMEKKFLHLYYHFGNKTIFMQATYTIKTNCSVLKNFPHYVYLQSPEKSL